MRTTCLMLMASASSLFAVNVNSQIAKVSITAQNASISNILKDIESQTDYLFVYNKSEIDLNRTVNINSHDQSVAEVLSNIFNNTNVIYAKEGTSIMLMQKIVTFQQQKITGTIVDATNNEPIIGASVLVEGTTIGVISDHQGQFSIELPSPNSVLVISYIGYNSEKIQTSGQSNLNITLIPDIKNLDEIVVVGYGTQKKGDITGAISSVSSDAMKDAPVANLQSAMEGKTAGVQVIQNTGAPGSTAQVRIRGLTSINNSDPLYVVDGNPLASNDINAIDPGNIASIDILKDASAQAIYGSRGANGVVLIKTKRGSKDNSLITFSTYQGVSQIRKTLDMLSASDYVLLNNEAYTNAGMPSPFANPPSYYTSTTDWQKEIFRSAMIQNYNLAISGGSQNSTYRISGGYLKQEGTIVGSDYKRANLLVNTTYNPKPSIELGENFAFNKSTKYSVQTDYYGNVVNDAYAEDPTIPVKDANGNYTATKYSDIVNPLAKIHYLSDNHPYEQWGLLGSTYLQYKPVKGLALRSSFSLDLKFSDDKQFTPVYDVAPNFNNPNAHLYEQKDQATNWTWDNTATYDFELNKEHHFTILAGVSEERFTYNYINGSNQGQPGDDPYLQYLDAGISNQSVGGSQQQWDLLSYIGRLNYNYRSTYFLTATIRRDGSSKFGANDRYGNFPSASLGWVATNESFLPKNNVLNYLKFRGSWGIVGNQVPVGYYDYSANINTYYYPVGSPATAQPTADPAGLPNPNLKWEQVKQWNAGFDYHLLNDHITGSFDYYQKTTKDMLLSLNILAESGFTQSPRSNAGSMKNSGIEFTAEYTGKITSDFNLNAGFHFATIRNKVLSLLQNGEKIYSGSFKPGNFELTQVGHPVASFYGYVADGIFQNQPEINSHARQETGTAPGDIRFKNLNNDSVIDQNDQTFLGSPIPKLTYGFNIGGNYKNIDFSIYFSGVYGNKVAAAYKYYTDGFFVSNYNMEKEALGRWTGPGTSNTLPRLIASDPNNNSRPSSFYLESGSYLRLQNISIGYTLPKNLLGTLKIKSMRVYISVENLLTFTKYKGYDPELGTEFGGSGGTLDMGIDQGNYPQSRTFSAGVGLSF